MLPLRKLFWRWASCHRSLLTISPQEALSTKCSLRRFTEPTESSPRSWKDVHKPICSRNAETKCKSLTESNELTQICPRNMTCAATSLAKFSGSARNANVAADNKHTRFCLDRMFPAFPWHCRGSSKSHTGDFNDVQLLACDQCVAPERVIQLKHRMTHRLDKFSLC